MSELFYKREVLLAFPDARIVTIGRPHGQQGSMFRVYSDQARYPLSGYKPDVKAAWADAYADLPKGKAVAAGGDAGQGSLFVAKGDGI